MNSDQDALAALTQRMADLGAPQPGGWASSEVGEGIPQQARYLVLRRIWANALMPWREPDTLRRNETLAQLLDRGADQELLAKALRGVVFNPVSDVIMIIDEGYDPDGWYAYSAKGFCAYDWQVWHSPYQRLSSPTVPISISELDIELRAVAHFAEFPVNFADEPEITVEYVEPPER